MFRTFILVDEGDCHGYLVGFDMIVQFSIIFSDLSMQLRCSQLDVRTE